MAFIGADLSIDERPCGSPTAAAHAGRAALPMARVSIDRVNKGLRDGRIRIISARKATRREQDGYFSQGF